MTIRFDESQVRSMGRASRGVRGIKLRQGDAVVGMVIVEEKAALFTVCENGYGKRTGLENYRPQSRGGVGLKNIKTTARNGKVVALQAVQGKDDLMMITAQGMIIRTGLDEIRSIGRNTQGVRLIKLKPGDKLVAAEKICPDEGNGSENGARPKDLARSQPEPEEQDEQELDADDDVDLEADDDAEPDADDEVEPEDVEPEEQSGGGKKSRKKRRGK
jgi:DNA gyrase subunit A